MLFDFFIYLSRADIFPWRVIIASRMEHEVITILKKRAIFEWCFTIIIPLDLWNNWIPFFFIFSIVSINFSFKISIDNYDFVNPFFLEIRIIVFLSIVHLSNTQEIVFALLKQFRLEAHNFLTKETIKFFRVYTVEKDRKSHRFHE